MNSYTLVDENNWKRREHCAIFRHYVEPSYCLTTDIDVTNFLGTVRDEGYSFTLSFIWLVSKCANEIEEFRYRFLSEKVVLFDRIDTLFAYMDEGDDLFKMVSVPFRDSLREYVTEAEETAKSQKAYFPAPPGIDVFRFAPIPGFHTTTSPTPTRGTGTTLPRCSTGGSTQKRTDASSCRSRCRPITRSWTGYTSED